MRAQARLSPLAPSLILLWPTITLPRSSLVARMSLFSSLPKKRGRWKRSASKLFRPTMDQGLARRAPSILSIYALSQTEPHLQPVFRAGLKELAAACSPDKFSELGIPQQIAMLKKLEHTDFFAHARRYTILGFLGDPSRHGNRGQVGWKYIGFENPGMFTHPFGYYDAEFLSDQKQNE